MSFDSKFIPLVELKARRIGKSEYVARAGASSVWVYIMLDTEDMSELDLKNSRN